MKIGRFEVRIVPKDESAVRESAARKRLLERAAKAKVGETVPLTDHEFEQLLNDGAIGRNCRPMPPYSSLALLAASELLQAAATCKKLAPVSSAANMFKTRALAIVARHAEIEKSGETAL